MFRGQFDGSPTRIGSSRSTREARAARRRAGIARPSDSKGDIAAFLEALDLHRVALCGWSFGGLAAYECVAAQGIDRLRALVIIDMTPSHSAPAATETVRRRCRDYTDGMAVGLIRDQVAFVRAGLDSMLSRAPTAADREWSERMQLQTPPETAISLLMSATLSDYRKPPAESTALSP